uniref:Uncharacterized protein n=1 Tax=Ananas comosus var. bracteatus TaxID=296719 RepID=A0A6V7PYB1_ANACO|nr:unnamed protein product [Ananas comosus var. bracteatus]
MTVPFLKQRFEFLFQIQRIRNDMNERISDNERLFQPEEGKQHKQRNEMIRKQGRELKMSGGVGSSRSNFKKGLIQPAHDWCMSVLRLIPMDGRSVTTGLKGRSSLFSFDLSSATDRFPLAVQGLIIEAKFNRLTAFAWVACGLGTNVFSCQTSRDSRRLGSSRLIRFATGQPLGFLSSWPLFALCHHFIVWYCAEKVYPHRVFKRSPR